MRHHENPATLILSVITLGIWLFVWAIVAMTSKEKRRVITVDEFGNVMR